MTSMIGNPGIRAPTGSQQGMTSTGGNVIPKGYKYGQLNQFTPEQHQLFQQMFGQLGPNSFLGRLAGGDQSQFEQMEAPALQQFNQLQSNLANKFSGMGMGARRSSGFQQAGNQAASDFAQALQGQRLGLQRQAIMDMMGLSESLLGQRPYDRFLVQQEQKTHPWLGASLPFLGAGLGGAAGFFTGGPAGALMGAKLGGTLGTAGSKAFF